ncbi:LysR family transcriptional regulator [Marinobacterium arenosum]|uniref:LysR family transcriptional regulator n=1 Tax=Marinobacterium arenosum TaxID=2862496 RepID=UPI001C94676F|nr:LysR family transcriptional regulator [Marinobacterium arenosum]MBY4677124.1 LysR family transcriptional regulator [Marinobacterium arenosum]
MEFRQLKYFVELAEAGSMSRAAVLLSIAQPAISRQLRNLEEELGMALFIRTGRGVELTDAGRVFLDRARAIITDIDDLSEEIRGLKGIVSGKVRIGLPPTESQFLSAPLVLRIKEKYPGVSLQIVEAFSGDVNEWLATGRIDLALFYRTSRTSQMICEELVDESLYLVSARQFDMPEADLDFTELADLPLILPSARHGLRVLVERVAMSVDTKLDIQFEVDSFLAIKDLVEASIGFTILPYMSVKKEVERGQLYVKRISPCQLNRSLVMSLSTQHTLTQATRVVARESRELVHELVKAGGWLGVI